jgi:hypothetical protein
MQGQPDDGRNIRGAVASLAAAFPNPPLDRTDEAENANPLAMLDPSS